MTCLWLITVPAFVCLVVGGVLGFTVHGFVLGLFIGIGLAGTKRLTLSPRLTDFRPVLLPVGGALGASLATFLFGVYYLPQLAAAAVFGWGAGTATLVFLLIRSKRSTWRLAVGVCAAAATVVAFHVMSLTTSFAWMPLGTAVAAAVLAIGIEVPAFFMRPPSAPTAEGAGGRPLAGWRSLALSAGVGSGAGVASWLAGHGLFGLGSLPVRPSVRHEWLALPLVSAVVGSGLALVTRLSEVATPSLHRRWLRAVLIGGVAAAFGIAISFLAKDAGASIVEKSWFEAGVLLALLVPMVVSCSYLTRMRTRGLAQRIAITTVVWISAGFVWAEPWPVAAAGLADGTQAASLMAMLPWKKSLGKAEDSRSRLVHFTEGLSDRWAMAWPSIFAYPDNAVLAKSFRCVKMPLDLEGGLAKRLGIQRPGVVFLTEDGREIDRYSSGCGGPNCDEFGAAASRALAGTGTFLYWQEKLAREPRNHYALKNVGAGLSKRGRSEEFREVAKRLDEVAKGEEGRQRSRWLARVLSARKLLSRGKPALDFAAETIEGEEMSLGQFRGSVVLLEFHHAWELGRARGKFRHKELHAWADRKGLATVSVVGGYDRAKVKRLASSERVGDIVVFENLAKAEDGVFWLYGVDWQPFAYIVERWPCAYLVDREGLVAARGYGRKSWDLVQTAEGIFEGEVGLE